LIIFNFLSKKLDFLIILQTAASLLTLGKGVRESRNFDLKRECLCTVLISFISVE